MMTNWVAIVRQLWLPLDSVAWSKEYDAILADRKEEKLKITDKFNILGALLQRLSKAYYE